MNSSQTARTSPGVSGPFQLAGAGKWRSRVAGRSRRWSVAHKTGRSATTSTRTRRGSVGFIPPFYPPPDFPKTTPNTSERPVDGSTITYTNATRIIDTTPVTNFRIEGAANAAVNIVDDPNGTENGFPATEVNSPAFAKVDFANKTNVTADVNGSTTVQATPKGTSTTINVSNVLGHPSIPVTL